MPNLDQLQPADTPIILKRPLNTNNRLWTARELARIGPEHRDRAVMEFLRVVEDPRSEGYDRAAALAELAAVGEPHRNHAIASLRGILADRGADPSVRCSAATELVRLGPEFHGEVVECALEIASSRPEPGIRATAWFVLRDLDTDTRLRSTAELRSLVTAEAIGLWDAYRDQWSPYQHSTTDDPESTASGLIDVLRAPHGGGRVRQRAAEGLIDLGRRFHEPAVEGLIALLRGHIVPDNRLHHVVVRAWKLGAGPRAELVAVLCEITREPFASPTALCNVVKALHMLRHRYPSEISTGLRAIVDDDATGPESRADAAMALARVEPAELTDASVVALRHRGQWPSTWARRAEELAILGADVVPHLHTVLADIDAQSGWRVVSAAILAQLRPDMADDAGAELRSLAADELLEFTWRTGAMDELVHLVPATRQDTTRYYRSILDDDTQPVADRCEAACQLVDLDESLTNVAISALHRFASNPQFTAEERWAALRGYFSLRRTESTETNRMGLALARDPETTAYVNGQLCMWMSGRPRLEVERSLLADRTASPSRRVGDLNAWEHQALGEQAEAVLRDVLTAADSTPAERVEAAAALGRLAPLHVPEAVRLLKGLASGADAAADALAELANLSLTDRRQIIADAGHVVDDGTRSWRERRDAAALICALASVPPERAVEYLRKLSCDAQVADADRVRILYRLRERDGLGRLRDIRDHDGTAPAVRWQAANLLHSFDATDRTAGLRTLIDIATDSAGRPALRWRAAHSLTRLGERGRHLGVTSLRAIASDDTQPVSARVNAAQKLGEVRPDQRIEVVRSLRGMVIENPRTRLRILQAVGRFDPLEGVLELSTMATDDTLAAGVRLRAAAAMAELRRDFRDRAAVTAGDIASDAACPWHVRLKAARQLARWSEPCRRQAQTLILELEEAGPAGRLPRRGSPD